jgi:hypothetical protein
MALMPHELLNSEYTQSGAPTKLLFPLGTFAQTIGLSGHSKLGRARALQRCDSPFIFPKAMKTQSQPRNVLATLRLTLQRLDRTGDFSSPSLADLRRILLERIAELEATERLRALQPILKTGKAGRAI